MIYIAPQSCSAVFYIIIIPDSDLFPSNITSTPRGVYSTRYHIGAALIMHMTITSCQVLTYGGVIQSSHDGIAAEEPRTRDLSVTVPTL